MSGDIAERWVSRVRIAIDREIEPRRIDLAFDPADP
jgi:hypothetical protein